MSGSALRRSRSPLFHRVLLAATVAAITWGALAFAAVYPWAYAPLAAACAGIGIAALWIERRGGPRIAVLAIAFTAIGATIAVQLLPLPQAALVRISPGADAFLRQYDLSYARPAAPLEAGGTPEAPAPLPAHPLSLDPGRTLLGLTLFTCFALFLLGLTRLISRVGARPLAVAITALGLLLTCLAMIQIALNPRGESHILVYGFWEPRYGGNAFGPFINRNHFAGWMLMAVPAALALFYATLEPSLTPSSGSERFAARWLAGSDAGRLGLFAFSGLVMGVALMMTGSRSGVASFAAGIALMAWTIVRRQPGRVARVLVATAFAALLLGALAWAGADVTLGKFFAYENVGTAGGRIATWHDTLRIIRDFPLTGTGLDAYGPAMVLYQTSARDLFYQEAHNDYLQVAAEGGLLVGVPVLCAIAIFVRDVRRRFREAPKVGTTYWLRVGAVIGLVSIALQSVFEFSLQMPGNAALFALLGAVALHQSPNLRAAASRPAVPDARPSHLRPPRSSRLA